MIALLNNLALWLADYFAMASALLVVAGLANWRLKHPRLRMACAWWTLAGLSAMLLVTAVPAWPRWDVRLWSAAVLARRPGAGAEPIAHFQEQMVSLEERPVSALPLLPSKDADAVSPSTAIRLPLAAASVWLALAAAALAWIALGAFQARRLLRTASDPPSWALVELSRVVGKRRMPRLRTSAQIGSAVALGALKPAIILPAEHVRQENRQVISAALAHEWAHVLHGDMWLLAWQRLLLPVLAAHPLFWILRRQIRADQELLADVAAAGERPVEYAEALLAWAKTAGPPPGLGLASLGMWENPHNISRRIQMILDPKSSTGMVPSPWKWLLPAVMLAAVGGLSLLTFRSTSVAGQEAPAADEPAPAAAKDAGPGNGENEPIRQIIQQLRTAAEQTSTEREQLQQENAALRKQIADLIDQIQRLRAEAVKDAQKAISDEEFLRRAYLDLLGVLPTPEQLREFQSDPHAEKRTRLIDKLLADPAFADCWARQWKELIGTPARPANAERAVKSLLAAAEQDSIAQGLDLATQRKLLEIDLEEASAKLDAAREDLASTRKLPQGAVSQQELRRMEAEVRQAELRLRRTKVLLDAVAAKESPTAIKTPPETDKPATGPATQSSPVPANLAIEIRLAEIDVRQAKLKLQADQTHWDRIQKLAAEKSVAQSELDAARIAVAQSQIAVERAETVLEGTRLKAQTGENKLKSGIRLAEIDLSEAVAKFRAEEDRLRSAEQLAAKGLVTQLQVDAQKSAVERAKLAAAEAERILKTLQKQQEKARSDR